MLGLVILLASYVFVGDRLKQAREAGPSLATRRFAERLADRAGHGAGRPPQPLRLRTLDHSGSGATRQARNSLRRGARDRTLDSSFACEHVHRPLAARVR